MNDRMAYLRKGEWLQIERPPVPEEVLFRWMAEQFCFPEKLWRKLHASGGIQLSKHRLSLRLFVADGETESAANRGWSADWQSPEVVFEDDFVIVVNKEAGCKLHPTEPGEQGTLVQRVAGHFLLNGEQLKVRVVHRLDRETSGLVVFAKGEFAQLRLDEMMRARQIGRVYSALVHGVVRESTGTIDAAIGRDRHRDRYRLTSRGGQRAVTHFRKQSVHGQMTLLELQLETGRTHQIRVHMEGIGHPLVGDLLYDGGRQAAGRTVIERQALHAGRLQFAHPWYGEPLDFVTPLPADMKRLLRSE